MACLIFGERQGGHAGIGRYLGCILDPARENGGMVWRDPADKLAVTELLKGRANDSMGSSNTWDDVADPAFDGVYDGPAPLWIASDHTLLGRNFAFVTRSDSKQE
nr:hypothetical protein [Microvirga arabica]